MIGPREAGGATSSGSEPLVHLTPKVAVPRSRAIEWLRGTRPLPDMDAAFYFQQSVIVGLITAEESLVLQRRHLDLTRREAAAARGEVACATCNGRPPRGFTCQACGESAPAAPVQS